MSDIAWKAEYELGQPTMDQTHREFIDWLARLDRAPEAEFLGSFDGFIAHTDAHFALERSWILASRFPADSCHLNMHDEILSIARFVREKVAEGNLKMGRKIVRELVDWFEDHAATMDTALATWIRDTGFDVTTVAPPSVARVADQHPL